MRVLGAKAVILAVAVSLAMPAAFAARFIDLSGNWAEKYVNVLSDRDVIPAAKDGKFLPDKPVTRAVLAAWLVKVLGIDNQPVPDAPSFPDVKKTDWFYKPVEIIRQNNYISGYADGFRPNQFIQRAEVITIVARTLGGATPDEQAVADELKKYKDGRKVPDWARAGVAQASRAGLLANRPSASTLEPTALATRADTAALLYQLQEHFIKQSIAEKVDEATQAGSPQQAGGPGRSDPYASAEYGAGAGAAASLPPAGASSTDYAQAGSGYPAGSPYGGGPPGGDIPGASGAPAYSGAGGAGGYPGQGQVYQGQVEKAGAAPGAYLQGRVTVVDAGTHFRATLNNTLNSGYNRPGEEFTATLSEPVTVNGQEVLPAGSKLVGQVTNVVSAHALSGNGRIDVKFVAVQTPDGRRYPLSASVDAKQLRQAGGVTQAPVTTAMKRTGSGAVKGAKWGGLAGGIVGAASKGTVGGTLKGAGVGAIAGSILGAGTGLVSSGVSKGTEVNVPAGMSLPIQLDAPLEISGAGQQAAQSVPAYPANGYPPPPYGGAYPAAQPPPYGGYPPQSQWQVPGGYPAQQPGQPYGGGYGAPPAQQPYAGYPGQQPY